VAAFREAIRLAPYWAYPRHNLALAYAQMGRFNEAIATYRGAMGRAPQFAYLPYNLGLTFQRINRNREAAAMYREAIDKAGRLPEDYRVMHLAMAHNALGYLESSTRSPERAEESYRQALTFNPNLLEARQNLAALLCGRRTDGACEAAREGEAIRLWRENIQQDKDYLPSRLSLARALTAQGKTSEAIAEYEQVVRLQPEYVAGRLALADLWAEAGDYERAKQQLTQARVQQPNHYNIHERLGDLERKGGDSTAAAEAYRSALPYAPDRKTRKRIEAKLRSADTK
jgi:tetratricopeptide (TPR) repeat protein